MHSRMSGNTSPDERDYERNQWVPEYAKSVGRPLIDGGITAHSEAVIPLPEGGFVSGSDWVLSVDARPAISVLVTASDP